MNLIFQVIHPLIHLLEFEIQTHSDSPAFRGLELFVSYFLLWNNEVLAEFLRKMVFLFIQWDNSCKLLLKRKQQKCSEPSEEPWFLSPLPGGQKV